MILFLIIFYMNIANITLTDNKRPIEAGVDSIKSNLCQRLDPIVKKTLLELGLALLATALVIPFSAVSLSAFLLGMSLIIGISVKAIQLAYKVYKNESLDDLDSSNVVKRLTKASVVSTIGNGGLNASNS